MTGMDVSPLVEAAVERAVLRSFDERPLRAGITQAEVRRRVAICEHIWKVLRLDKHWSIQRACDHIHRFLICEIDGVPWEPSDRSIWVPDGARQGGHLL